MNYYYYQNEIISCKNCDWKGLGSETVEDNILKNGFYIYCPECHEEITFVNYPTTTEIKLFGSDWDKQNIMERQMVLEQFNKEKLMRADQLADINNDDNIIIEWDQENDRQIIKYKETILWTEHAFYENYERYLEIGLLLKEKYGSRLRDFIPIKRSELYLYGDVIRSPLAITAFRLSLKN